MSFRSPSSVSLVTERSTVRVVGAVFLLSAAAIADEIFLIRLLSLRFWPHFVPLILSQAMLGFGASGIALHWLKSPISRSPKAVFAWLVLLAAPSFELAYRASLRVPFDPYILLWEPSSWPSFALFFLVLSIPFFLAGAVVGVPLSFRIGDPGWVYGASFAGSAAGALLTIPASSLLRTESLLLVPTVLGLAAALSILTIRKGEGRAIRAVAVLATLGVMVLPPADPALSPFKDLAITQKLPGVREIARVAGPSGDTRVLFAPGLHVAPGLSFRFPGELPPQAALFGDGELRGILPEREKGAPPRYFSWFPQAIPYRLSDRPEVLQLSLHGTEGILAASANGATSVTVVEPSPEPASIVRTLLEEGGGPPGGVRVRIVEEGARSYLSHPGERFDIVELTGISTISYSSVGIHAAGETFLLTREGIDAAFSRIRPGGFLSVSGWLKAPPRESVKILRTLREVMDRRGRGPVRNRILMVRGWGTFTIAARTDVYTRGELEAAERFCAETGFTVVWPPGRSGTDLAEGRVLARAVESALSGPPETDRLFDLRPVTDDSPYFYRFFRLGSIGELRRILGAQWMPFLEWGILFLLISLAVSSVLSAILLLVPALAQRAGTSRVTLPRAGYFSALGLGYMLIELSFLKFGILLAGHPFPAAVAAIGGFTFFSGAGSILSGKIVGSTWGRRMIFPGIACVSVGGFLVLFHAASRLLPLAAAPRLLLFLAALAPSAFLMGIPFPAGLARLGEESAGAIPFAWGINGFCSVAGASLASVGALWLGFRWTLVSGALLYLFAGLWFGRLGIRRQESGEGGAVTASGRSG